MQKTSALEKAIELANIGLAELDTEGHFVSANSWFLSMLGFHEPDLIGRHWRATIHPDDRFRVEAAYSMARTEGRGYVEIRAVHRDSSIVYQALTVTSIIDEVTGFAGYSCLRYQISDYRRNREALMLAVESSPNCLAMLSANGAIELANQTAEKLFGYGREELLGNTFDILLPERFQAEHQERLQAFSSEAVNAIEGRDFYGVRKDGVEIPLQMHLNRMETNNGDLILCTIVDISERVEYRQRLELAMQVAEAANRAKSDFLSRMSHEIRTPMNLIMGMNSLLLESTLTEKQRQHVEISHRNVRRLLRLINGILDLSKVEAGKLTLTSVAFDLKHVLKECEATLSSAIEQSGLQFEISIHPDAGQFWIGDSERLHQVLLNLIGNSIKFTEKGMISVDVLPEEDESGKMGLRFVVSDTGCGIPEEKTTIVFEVFQQADGAMNRPYEGTGLGLSIARTIVEMMGGRIWVEPKAGPGTRVVFTTFFPHATEDAVKEEKSASKAKKVMRAVEAGTRILLVEDNPENVILMQAYLENLPLSLDLASNGAQAIDMRRRVSYHLILMDIQMPVMDGYTATREIRAWEQEQGAQRVPIVALTAHALTGANAESMEAGCDGHLTKPVDQHDLIEAIARFAKSPVPKTVPVLDSIAARRPGFLANRQLDLTKMREALAAGDFDAVQVIGHNCKGIGSGYGFPDISALGFAIENAARALDADALHASLQQFEECVDGAAAGSPAK